MPRSFTSTRIAVRFTSTRQPTRPSAPPYNTMDDSPVRPGHRFTRLRRFTTRRTTYSSIPVYSTSTDSSMYSVVIDFSVTMVVINSAVDNFRPSISGDIHLRSILLAHIIFIKEQFLWLVIFLRQDNCSLHQNDMVNSPIRAGLQHRGRFICLSHL